MGKKESRQKVINALGALVMGFTLAVWLTTPPALLTQYLIITSHRWIPEGTHFHDAYPTFGIIWIVCNLAIAPAVWFLVHLFNWIMPEKNDEG